MLRFDVHPVVTAVIPTRNRPELVQRAVRSALEQTFRKIEVLVVIDGPDPASIAALELIQDDRLRVIMLDASVGGAEARNVGARAARGEFVALLDDDDEWLPEKIELQLRAASASGSARSLVVSKYICRSETADRIRPRRMPQPDENICEYMFDFLCYFQTSTFFCTKALLLEVPFRKSLGGFQDIDWFLRVNSYPGVRLSVLADVLSVYYAPEERATITSNLAWQKRLAWGQEHREFMTKRAYSRFIVGSCVGRAVEERAGWRALWLLFREYAFEGSPTFTGLLLLVGLSVARPQLRRRVRNALFLSPASKASAAHP
jgi:glycosyltransferase involved in cell wall biosynthesis